MRSTHHAARVPISFLRPGEKVRVEYIDAAVSALQREQLDAYGLSHDRPLSVLQQQPMTVVSIDEVELALEASVARHVWVTGFDSPTALADAPPSTLSAWHDWLTKPLSFARFAPAALRAWRQLLRKHTCKTPLFG